MDAARLNAAMVAEVAARLKDAGVPLSPAVLEAFLGVPRHLFVPDVPLEEAYRDQSIILKDDGGVPCSSSSQPTIMAIMLEQLALRSGDRVLELGVGSGYNAALLARLVGGEGRVVTLDLDGELVAAARERFAAAGADGVEAIVADGGFGWPAAAPYDAIVPTEIGSASRRE